MLGVGITGRPFRHVLSDMPALKPYWGKPAMRNLGGGDGSIGIIRIPARAIAPLNRKLSAGARILVGLLYCVHSGSSTCCRVCLRNSQSRALNPVPTAPLRDEIL